jgi:hypothetical protein
MPSNALRATLPTRYQGLQGKVLVHVGDNTVGASMAALADGLVFHGPAGFKAARACPPGVRRLVDREHYSSDRGKGSQGQLIPESPADAVRAQVNAGATSLLAPSRFPTDRTHSGIASVLEAGAAFIGEASIVAPDLPAFVPVVIRYDELIDDRWVEPIRSSGVPIATVFAGYGDPLASTDQLEGAINVIEAADVAFVLRCDMSVAGLMAHSAIAGAIGASSAVRHLWLPKKGGTKSIPTGSLFVPHAANWMKSTFIEQAQADPELDEFFRCECPVCGVGGDLRHLMAPEVSSDLQDRHSVAAAVALARSVVEDDDALAAWRRVCKRADAGYDMLSDLGISGPSKPSVLTAWLKLLG